MVIASIRDLTDQRAIEAVLRDREAQLRLIAVHTDVVFVVRGFHPWRYLYTSPRFKDLLGYDPEELDGMASPSSLPVHPDDIARVSEAVARSAQSKGTIRISPYRFTRKDGRIIWLRTEITSLLDANCVPDRSVSTVREVREQVEAVEAIRAAETEAHAANDAKNLFLSRMSHELRTPLNAVLGFGQLLEQRLAGTANEEAVGHIVRAGMHLLTLIDEVLDIARIESGDMLISMEPVAVAHVVEECVALMQPMASSAGVTLNIADAPDTHLALADRHRLRQVLLNLLSNAVKYNIRGGLATIGWVELDGRVAITVTDDGPGIPAELQLRLFTPFDRLGAEATSVEGTGIGLSHARGLATMMGGELTFHSAEGHGSTFTVTLAAAGDDVHRIADAIAPRPTPAIHVADSSSKSWMLYVEDNVPSVRVMEALLELRPGWGLIHAGLGRLGIDLARSHVPDLIVLDLHLPDCNGLDVLHALKAVPATSAIPVVVLSADARVVEVRQLGEAGAWRYMTKPLILTDVLEMLDWIADGQDTTAV